MALRIKQDGTGVTFTVKVVPGSSKMAISGLLGDALKVNIAAPPQKGKANERLIKLLALTFCRPQSNFSVASGARQSRKEIHVAGMTAIQLRQLLAEYLER